MSKPLKILCTREFQNSISDSVHKLLTDVIRSHNLGQWFSIKNAEIYCNNGSSFIFKGLAHNIDSIKSTEGVDVCWVEEADKVSQNSWDILIPTIRKPNSKFFITFNPTFDDDPVYKMFVTGKPLDAVVTQVSYRDNPHFPEVLRREMEHMRANDYEKYLHVWEGELRTVSDAQVFKGKFVVEDFSSDDIEAFYHGMDFGFATDPTAVVRMFVRDHISAVTGYPTKRLYIDREAVGYGVEITETPNMLDKVLKDKRYKIGADCARPETISYLANLGYNIHGAKKWQGSVEDGIEFLKGFEKIVIHPSCVHTIQEFTRYGYKIDKHTNEILPIVVDAYNHCIDASRYALDDMIKKKTTIYDAGVMYG